MEWFWPNADQLNDYPDPVGFDAEWTDWVADLAEAPPVVAEIFAREYIQNSVDAIRTQKELIAELTEKELIAKLGIALGSKKFGINFRFIELRGKNLEKFAQESGLEDFQSRYQQMSEKEKVSARLNTSTWLETEGQPESLQLLVCEEVGGVGMYGHWWTQGLVSKEDSRLKLALIQTKSEKGSKVSGGSWGHGKKAIANASKCRTLFAYTCFIKREQPSEDDAGITRRLTGVAYWKSHRVGNNKVCQGLGIFGNRIDQQSDVWAENFMPLDEKSADDCISQFGVSDIAVRSSKQADQCGTTYIIVEPAFNATDLVQAIERNWWPLILKEEISISVTDTKGDDVEIAPQSQTPLAPFLQAYELLDGSKTPAKYELREEVKVSHSVKGRLSSGTIALTSDTEPNGWSYSEEEDAASLVCLVRGDMVIAYQPSPPKRRGQPPFVRGVFVVDSETNKESAQILRLAEPHLHNSWQTKDENIVSPEDRKYADDLMKLIHRHVKDLRTAIKGVRRPINTQFQAFSNIFKSGKAGVTKKPKPKQSRWFSIQYPHGTKRVSGSSNDTLSLSAECEISLRDTPKNPAPNQLAIRVTLYWSVQEEGLKTDLSLLDVGKDVVPKGFSSVGAGVYEGVIMKDDVLVFKWHSQEFSTDWSVAPTPIVEKVV